jgi:curved DNA-binding protein CbpA
MKKSMLTLLLVMSFGLQAESWKKMDPIPNYYGILGVKENATGVELKKAYHKKSLVAHPDKEGGSNAAFRLVKEAYDTLTDTKEKREYDKALNAYLNTLLSEGWEIL